MSGNVFMVCLTIIICSLIFAFCHWTEHQCDISDDRYQYLCGQTSDLKKRIDTLVRQLSESTPLQQGEP